MISSSWATHRTFLLTGTLEVTPKILAFIPVWILETGFIALAGIHTPVGPDGPLSKSLYWRWYDDTALILAP